jgi:RNA polymerase sigma-70 factor, ECF subfamily
LSVEARYLEPELPDELDDAYAQTFDRLRRMFRARGCSPEESADLAQEAAIRAFTHIRRWGVTGGLDPLLNRIARNLLIDRYRRVTPHLVPLDSADDMNDPTQDPTEEVERRQRRTAVQSAIRSLPVRHQKAIVYSLSGLSPEEVGRQMGIGRNAADALLHRARRSLREHLAPVREGIWGVALAFRVRWDRTIRRMSIESGLTDASHLAAFQSAITIAAAAVVGVLSVAGANAPASASATAWSRRYVPATVSDSSFSTTPETRTGSGGGGGGGTFGGGWSSRSAWSFGGVAGGSIGRDGSDTRVDGPRDPATGRPIIWLQQHQYGKDGPADDPIGRALNGGLDGTCRISSAPCSIVDGY